MSFGGFLKGAARVAGGAVKYAGPALTGTVTAGPVGGVLAVVGQISGGGAKRHGKAREEAAGSTVGPIQKVTAPLASMGVPAGVAALAATLGLDLSGGLGVLCTSGELSAAGLGFLMGVLALLSHLLGHGLQDSARRR